MKLAAQLDVDVVALQTDEEVTCLLRLEAPPVDDARGRPGETLIVVADRSGSMSGAPLAAVCSALRGLVDRMKPQDSFGLVTFDNRAELHIPTLTMSDHHTPTLHALIDRLRPGNKTDLSTGYLLGLDQARRHPSPTGSHMLLLSDGHANAGIVDPSQLGALAARGNNDGISTTTIGIGPGYDETLLVEISNQGKGAHRFAYTADDAEAVLAQEAGDLLSKSVVNIFLRIRPRDPGLMDRIGTLADATRWAGVGPDGQSELVIPLGDMYSGEAREVLFQMNIPGIARLGAQEIATLAIDYVALPALESQSITWPIAVNVVPGEEASLRMPDPAVTTARLIAEVNKTKRDASEALRVGNTELAALLMDAEALRLKHAADAVHGDTPEADALRTRLHEEEEQARRLARGAREHEAHLARKSFEEDRFYGDRWINDTIRSRERRNRRDW